MGRIERRDLLPIIAYDRQHDDRNVGEGPDPSDDLGPVEVGQAQIEEDEIQGLLGGRNDRLLAVGGRPHLVTVRPEARLRIGVLALEGSLLSSLASPGDTFVVEFDVPGIDPASVDLTVEKNVLTLSAERSRRWEDGAEVIVNERPAGRFSRQLFLGETLDAERISATSENGVLRVTIPVAERAKARRVEVGVGSIDTSAIDTSAIEAGGS